MWPQLYRYVPVLKGVYVLGGICCHPFLLIVTPRGVRLEEGIRA